MDNTTSFQLTSAMRFDESRPWQSLLSTSMPEVLDSKSPILLLSYHRDRLVDAGEALGWTRATAHLRQNITCERMLYLACNEIKKARAGDRANEDKAVYKVSLFGHLYVLICLTLECS